MPHDTSRFNTGEPARQLYERWRATSLEIGWAFPDDWWVPPVDEVIEALCAGRDPAGPCVELGRARAEAGVSLREAPSSKKISCSSRSRLRRSPCGSSDGRSTASRESC